MFIKTLIYRILFYIPLDYTRYLVLKHNYKCIEYSYFSLQDYEYNSLLRKLKQNYKYLYLMLKDNILNWDNMCCYNENIDVNLILDSIIAKPKKHKYIKLIEKEFINPKIRRKYSQNVLYC